MKHIKLTVMLSYDEVTQSATESMLYQLFDGYRTSSIEIEPDLAYDVRGVTRRALAALQRCIASNQAPARIWFSVADTAAMALAAAEVTGGPLAEKIVTEGLEAGWPRAWGYPVHWNKERSTVEDAAGNQYDF